jgi:dTDP-glucose 4,6-dehydratase
LAIEATSSILVTGGAGFIGSNFVRFLLDEYPECHITVLDKLTYAGNLRNLALVLDNPRLTFIRGDICDPVVVRRAMRDCALVVNFAAETHVDRSILDPGIFVHTDVEGTYTLLEAAREQSIRRFIQISTDEVYGNTETPDHTSSRPSLETDVLRPSSPYAASKASADLLASSYRATYRLPVVITRCTNNYGPYQHPEKQVPLFIADALSNRRLPVYGDGRNTREWIHVLDHCRALKQILEAPGRLVDGEIFNVGGAEERSILENAELILDLMGKSPDLICFVPDRPGHVRRHSVDSTKLKANLGWQPSIRFREGITSTIEWYSSHSAWLERIFAHQDSSLDRAPAQSRSVK